MALGNTVSHYTVETEVARYLEIESQYVPLDNSDDEFDNHQRR